MDSSNFIVLTAIILMFLIGGYPMVRDKVFHAKANREGIIVDATITHKRKNTSRYGMYCSLEYTYLSYERLEYVKPKGYEAVKEGEQIKIVYLSSDPQDARIIDTRVKDV